MELADGIFESEAQRTVSAILGDDVAHGSFGILLVVFRIVRPNVSLEHAHADDLVAVVNQLVEQPLQRIIGVSMLVHADHERARPAPMLVALVADIECHRGGIVLSSFPNGDIVECDMVLEPVVRGVG